jgi:hypothetical protein
MKENTIVARITESSQKLMLAMNKGSIDGGIKFMWAKLCVQGKTINTWQKESGCKTPAELRVLLDKLYQENNKLRENKL